MKNTWGCIGTEPKDECGHCGFTKFETDLTIVDSLLCCEKCKKEWEQSEIDENNETVNESYLRTQTLEEARKIHDSYSK